MGRLYRRRLPSASDGTWRAIPGGGNGDRTLPAMVAVVHGGLSGNLAGGQVGHDVFL